MHHVAITNKSSIDLKYTSSFNNAGTIFKGGGKIAAEIGQPYNATRVEYNGEMGVKAVVTRAFSRLPDQTPYLSELVSDIYRGPTIETQIYQYKPLPSEDSDPKLFRLAGYGLPEPGGAAAPTPLYLKVFAVGLVFVAASLSLTYFVRRLSRRV